MPCPCGVAGARAPVELRLEKIGKIARPTVGFLFWDRVKT